MDKHLKAVALIVLGAIVITLIICLAFSPTFASLVINNLIPTLVSGAIILAWLYFVFR